LRKIYFDIQQNAAKGSKKQQTAVKCSKMQQNTAKCNKRQLSEIMFID
jgi:hypothetical protein